MRYDKFASGSWCGYIQTNYEFPVPDREKMRIESQRLVHENVKVREKEIAQGNFAE